MNVTLLGPQRNVAAARAAVAELMPDGAIATVNAGWRERESDSAELSDVLGGRMRNLELYRRWQQLIAEDAGYADEERTLTLTLNELQSLYTIRLRHAMAALQAVTRRRELPQVAASARDDCIAAIQALDRWHLDAVARARTEFYTRVRLGERATVARHRSEIADQVAGCSGLVVTGGHVGVLLHVLHVFGLARLITEAPHRPLITWSAGAMALSDRVVLFHDHLVPPESAGLELRPAELFAEGLGIYSGVLPFPHARRRLRLDDPDHVRQMAQRFSPRRCLVLPDGVRVDLRDDEPFPAGARWLPAA
ncbi:MAG: hypothetical protein QOF52_1990 [Propionibacteriaceae bacterium]|jgi:hypothetical protein|nr:hypothetical protein [Propionibacteriaceae bacterium]